MVDETGRSLTTDLARVWESTCSVRSVDGKPAMVPSSALLAGQPSGAALESGNQVAADTASETTSAPLGKKAGRAGKR